MHHELHYHLFKLGITQLLKPVDYHAQTSFAETMLETTDNGFNVKNLTSDKERFHLTSAVNDQNCSYWALSSDDPHIIRKKTLHNLRVTEWTDAEV